MDSTPHPGNHRRFRAVQHARPARRIRARPRPPLSANPVPPSSPAPWEDRQVAFLARHGIGHHISPTEVNYCANIYALKSLGVERVVSISACGSLREDYVPGDLVIPDQIFDLTRNRRRSFFGDGLVAHIGVADPFCPDLSSQVYEAVKATGGISASRWDLSHPGRTALLHES